MWINWNPTSVVPNCQRIIGVQFHLNAVRMPCNGFVHRVIKDFSDHMMQCTFIGAADIHARAFSDRFQTLQNLNGRCAIIVSLAVIQKISHVKCSIYVSKYYDSKSTKGKEQIEKSQSSQLTQWFVLCQQKCTFTLRSINDFVLRKININKLVDDVGFCGSNPQN